jgi:hypothetical protein
MSSDAEAKALDAANRLASTNADVWLPSVSSPGGLWTSLSSASSEEGNDMFRMGSEGENGNTEVLSDESILDGLNEYQKVILSVGSIIEEYDTDKIFPLMGFGAKIPNPGRTRPYVKRYATYL